MTAGPGRPFFFFGVARVFRCSGSFLRLRWHLFQQQLLAPSCTDVGVLRIPQGPAGSPRPCPTPGTPGVRAPPSAPRQGSRTAPWSLPGGMPPATRTESAGSCAHGVKNSFCRAVVGHIAAALAGDKDLLGRFVHVLQHRYLMPPAARQHPPPSGLPHLRSTINTFAICFPPKKPSSTFISYQNRPAKAMCCGQAQTARPECCSAR